VALQWTNMPRKEGRLRQDKTVKCFASVRRNFLAGKLQRSGKIQVCYLFANLFYSIISSIATELAVVHWCNIFIEQGFKEIFVLLCWYYHLCICHNFSNDIKNSSSQGSCQASKSVSKMLLGDITLVFLSCRAYLMTF
jgi:hypothetical protein